VLINQTWCKLTTGFLLKQAYGPKESASHGMSLSYMKTHGFQK